MFMRKLSVVGVLLCWPVLAASVLAENPLGIVPTPKQLNLTGGEMPLTPQSRIVAADEKLKPLAAILSDEILLITRLRLEPAEGEARPGDIVLKINPQLRADADILTVQNREVKKVRDYAHTINVADKAVVEGWDYRACCEGTATLLQALKVNGAAVLLPKMQIKDWPHADYNCYMIDCARQGLPLMGLKACIECMRYYKTRYLHLHASDDCAFYFPLKSYPQAGSHNGACNNGDAFKSWDLEELKKVVAYADARGVTLVPEIETPGHCTCLQEDLKVGDKYLLGSPGVRMFDLANDDIYPVLEKIINDMCDIFQSSPYFHIGGDEIQWDWFKGQPHVKDYLKKHGMREIDKGGTDDLAKQHVLRLNEFIKKRGKKTIYWGGYQGPPQDPAMTDCIVYSWYAGAREAQDRGFTTISVPWEIRGDRPRWTMYSSNGDMLKRTDRVLGSCRVAWEQSGESYVNNDCYGQDRAEGTWSPDAVCTAEEEAKGFPKPVPGYAEAMRERLKKADVNLAQDPQDGEDRRGAQKEGPDWPVPDYSGTATITHDGRSPGRLQDPLHARWHGADGRIAGLRKAVPGGRQAPRPRGAVRRQVGRGRRRLRLRPQAQLEGL